VTDVVRLLADNQHRMHRLVVELASCERVTGATEGGQLRRRAALTDDLRRRFVQLETARERSLYPVVRRRLPNGEETVREFLGRKREIEEILIKLRWHSERAPTINVLADAVVELFREHLRADDALAAQLAGVLDPAEREQIGSTLERLGRFGPIRPHPELPTAPWAAAVLGRPLAVVDRIVERLTSTPYSG
jgi:hypothetical protein